MLKFFFLTLICVSSVLSQAQYGDVTVEPIGKSGQIRLCRGNDCSNRYIKLKLGKLEEYSADGKKEQAVPAFASQSFTWSAPVDGDINNVTAKLINFDSSVVVKGKGQLPDTTVPFVMTAALFTDNGTISNGDQDVNVTEGALKLTLEIGDWPFLDSSNTLRFSIFLSYKKGKDDCEHGGDEGGDDGDCGGDDDDGEERSESKDSVQFRFADDFILETPTQVVADGDNVDIEAMSVTRQGSKIEVSWEFPAFETDLVFDPVIQDVQGSGAVRLWVSFAMLVAAALILIQ